MRFALLALLFAAPAFAQVSGPTDISVPAGRLAAVPITIDGGSHEYAILGDQIDGFREYDPDPKKLRLRVIGYSAGVAWVVVGTIKGNEIQPLHIVRVTIGGTPTPPVPPGPGPGPGPKPPDPPTPDKPHDAEVLAAIQSDAGQLDQKKVCALAYAGLLSVMDGHLEQVRTVGELLADFRTAAKDVMPPGSIPGTQKVCVAKFFDAVGRNADGSIDEDKALDAATKAKLRDVFGRAVRSLKMYAEGK